MDKLIDNLSAIVGREHVLSKPDELLVYECDGLPHHKHRPRAVVFPSSTEETSGVMRELARAGVPFTPRGAGTGLSGGALALNSGVVIEMARMRKILRIDVENRLAVVQPGVVNLHVSRAAAPFGLYYVPDPSSQPTCTIGGNIAESAGGIHCLKYGTTTDHVLGCRVVLAGGEVVDLGGGGVDLPGYDLLGTFIGSEGTFGVATEATLRLSQNPPSIRTLLAEFLEVNDASHAVSAIIAAGVMPAALEMMDREIIRAVEASVFAAGLPPDAGAALLIELDGLEAGLDDEAEKVISICMEYGARNCRYARDEAERKKLWAARKGAFGAIGRITPDSMIQDAVVPRSRLPQVLGAAYDIASRYQLRIANVFHAGDGNLHPLICFDSRSADEVARVRAAGSELMQVCVAAGGTITGEHGVGLDKRELLPLVFSDDDMNAMLSVRAAFDPLGLCNPGKIIPLLRGCGEGKAIAGDKPSAPEQPIARRELNRAQPVTHSPFDADRAATLLAQLVGESNVLAVNGSVTVSPANDVEICETINLVSTEGWNTLTAGGRAWLDYQSGPATQIIISTSRLNQIVEHEPADLIAVAQAGVKLADFNKVLGENGQWLPLDPPNDGRATIGGVVATGLGGTQQFAYGRPRGSVIGMKVVLADGSQIKAGGRVVKNVAGYDLCKLFTGSFGSLGVITEVNFKLRPRPEREATVIVNGAMVDLIESGQALMQRRLFPVATEIISPAFAARLGISSNNATMVIRFAGNKKGVAYQINESLSFLQNATVETNDRELWQKIASAPFWSDHPGKSRVSILPADLAKVFETNKDAPDQAIWQIGVLDGRIQMSDLKVDTTTVSAGAKTLMERVKQQLDPFNVFAPRIATAKYGFES